MDVTETPRGIGRNASAVVIIPIAGMMGGLIVGGIRAWALGLTDLNELTCIIKWAVTGFFAGLALVVLLAIQFRGRDVISVRRLMALVAVAGLLTWFFARVFSGAVGPEGF
jgi:hypothetical protein